MQIALGVLPLVALAAYSDVRLTTVPTITVGGISLVLVGNADMDSITVDSSTLTIVMTEGSYLSVTSADRRTISASNVGSIKVTSSCTDSLSSYTYESPNGAPSSTITLTIESGTCSSTGGSGSPGGSGGSSGGSSSSYIYVPPVTQTAALVKAAPKATVTAPAAVSAISINITRAFAKGATSPQIKTLQQLLNSDPETRIVATGAGSPGQETNFFGPATLKAIQKFQVKYGIAKPGVEGYGVLGPKTRAKLNELGAKGVIVPTATPSASATQTTAIQKQIDAALAQIKILQEQLKKAK